MLVHYFNLSLIMCRNFSAENGEGSLISLFFNKVKSIIDNNRCDNGNIFFLGFNVCEK